MNEEQTNVSIFQKLSEVDVNHLVAMRDGFGYLPWSQAVYLLRINDPSATWEVKRFATKSGSLVPYLQTPLGYFVEVAVTCGGVTLSQIHPVFDENNLPITTPTVNDIHNSTQRCLVKAIALHGLGLQVYAGEESPLGTVMEKVEGGKSVTEKTAVNSTLIQAITKINSATLEEISRAEKFSGQLFEGNDLKSYREAIAARKEALLPKTEDMPS